MKQWLRRVRGAVGLGITWALCWAPVAVLIGFIVDPDNSMDEMWPAIGAYPGFLGGVVFSIVLGIAARHRRLDELSVPRTAAWGALAGLIVGTLPFLIGDAATDRVWLLATVVIGTITALSAASAAGSLALAQRAERRSLTTPAVPAAAGLYAAPDAVGVAAVRTGAKAPAVPTAAGEPALPSSPYSAPRPRPPGR